MPAKDYDLGPEYDQIKPTAKMFGVSKALMQQLVTDEKVESFLLRRNAYSRQGVRLVKISSVRAYFEREAAEYKKAKAAGELPVVAEKGREVLKANRARRRAPKRVGQTSSLNAPLGEQAPSGNSTST